MFKRALVSATFCAVLMVAGAASAATYDFTTRGSDVSSLTIGATSGGGPLIPTVTVTPGTSGISNITPMITRNSDGLGVSFRRDGDPDVIDGSPLGTSEYLTVTFGWAVKLISIGLDEIDSNDHFDISINGGAFTNSVTALMTNVFNLDGVTSFVLRASGTSGVDGNSGNDNFTLASITVQPMVAPVPVPAAFGLLAMALGGLGLARRGRKAA